MCKMQFDGGILCVVIIVGVFDFYSKPDPTDILVEAHGLVFDLIVFGLIITYFEFKREKKDSIARYQANIRRCIGWHTIEARQILKESIEKLNDLNVTENFHMPDCFFDGINLPHAKLNSSHISDLSAEKAFLPTAEFQDSSLYGSSFYNAALSSANFYKARLYGVDFSYAHLTYANFQYSNLRDANLEFSNLIDADFASATLDNVKLSGAKVGRVDWIENLVEINVIGGDYLKDSFTVNPTQYYFDEEEEKEKIINVEDDVEVLEDEIYYKIEERLLSL